jgi:hypothetical protein
MPQLRRGSSKRLAGKSPTKFVKTIRKTSKSKPSKSQSKPAVNTSQIEKYKKLLAETELKLKSVQAKFRE